MIEARSISFAYRSGQADVVHDLSACAEVGTITAVLGPNAIGKTTLLRLLIGTLQPTHGSVLLGGRPLKAWRDDERATHLAYVAQVSSVDAPFTVRDVVEFGTYPHPTGRERRLATENALEQCEITEIAHRRYHDLSVGQQQRVSLARALAQLQGGGENQALLLDEPVAAMDPKHTAATARLLRTLTHKGTTVIMVLHDVALAQAFADHVWGIHGGRVICDGAIRDVLTLDVLRQLYGVPFVSAREQAHGFVLPDWKAASQDNHRL